MAQTFEVVATPRARFWLAQLLFTVKFKDRPRERSFYRALRALGLTPIMRAFQRHARTGQIGRDDEKTSRFAVTEDNADILVSVLATVEKDASQVLAIEDVLEQLEAKQTREGVEEVSQYDPATEDPLWEPDFEPLVDQPIRVVQLLDEVFAQQSYGAASKAWRSAREAEAKDQRGGGEVVPLEQAG